MIIIISNHSFIIEFVCFVNREHIIIIIIVYYLNASDFI